MSENNEAIDILKTAINCIENDLPCGLFIVLDDGTIDETSAGTYTDKRPIFYAVENSIKLLDKIFEEADDLFADAVRHNLHSILSILEAMNVIMKKNKQEKANEV